MAVLTGSVRITGMIHPERWLGGLYVVVPASHKLEFDFGPLCTYLDVSTPSIGPTAR